VIVQVIGGVPVTEYAKLSEELDVVVPGDGEMIVTTGAVPRVTVTGDDVIVPAAFVHAT
jgi:hypothetical protein